GKGLCDKCRKKLQRKTAPGGSHRDASVQDLRAEQEADRVAIQILEGGRGIATPIAEGLRIRRFPAGADVEIGEIPQQALDAVGSAGSPLDFAVRNYLEPRFGYDFSRVRVHVNDAAASSVEAHAFTMGEHIVFAAGQYRPSTHDGLKLLAHELTHVVQQGNSGPTSSSRFVEAEADAASTRALRGQPLSVTGAIGGQSLHRDAA